MLRAGELKAQWKQHCYLNKYKKGSVASSSKIYRSIEVFFVFTTPSLPCVCLVEVTNSFLVTQSALFWPVKIDSPVDIRMPTA